MGTTRRRRRRINKKKKKKKLEQEEGEEEDNVNDARRKMFKLTLSHPIDGVGKDQLHLNCR